MQYNALIPELYVSDIDTSLRFYIEVLGFKLEYGREQPRFVFLSYLDTQLMLQQREPIDNHTGPLELPYGRGVNFQIRTQEVAALAFQRKEHGHTLRRDVTEYWRDTVAGSQFGSRELQVLDPDGYYLRFSEPLGERPKVSPSPA